MKKLGFRKTLFTIMIMVLMRHAPAKDFIIYNISQNFPMGEEKEIIEKNYYINMGSKQGVKSGNTLEVFRIISKLDPYQTKKRFNFKVKIGKIRVLHTEDQTSICNFETFQNKGSAPLLDINSFMIGDLVGVKTN